RRRRGGLGSEDLPHHLRLRRPGPGALARARRVRLEFDRSGAAGREPLGLKARIIASMHTRRHFLHSATVATGALTLPLAAFAQERRFAPGADGWRTFELTTRVTPAMAQGTHQVWVPIPS